MSTVANCNANSHKRTVIRNMIKINADGFYDDDYNVVDKASLNFFEPKDNSNKFYIAEIHESTTNRGFRLYINYGRVGRDGVENAQAFSTITSATSEFNKKVNSKIKKGYIKVDLATSSRGSTQGKNQVNASSLGSNATAKIIKSKLDPEIQSFITDIYSEANHAVSMAMTGSAVSDVKAPLGNLGVNGIKKARDVLQDLANYNKSGDLRKVEELSIIYYKNVPRKMPNNLRSDLSWLLDSPSKIQREFDTLILYEDTLRMLPVMGTSDIDMKYSGLNCDISVVDAETLEYIKKKVNESRASNHHFVPKVIRAFEVNQKNAPQFNSNCGNVRRLFHGSRSANIVGIMSSHLKLPHTLKGVHITGAMFGGGIYFASESTKALNYSMGTWGGQQNKSRKVYMFICDVALGEVYKCLQAKSFSRAPNGYNSVMGVGAKTLNNMIARGELPANSCGSLINNEFIIYDQSRQKIKYIVELEIN